MHVRQRAARVHRILPPTFVTIAKRPSLWDGMICSIAVSTKRERKKFLRKGLDRKSVSRPSGNLHVHLYEAFKPC
jgi:hypothetical protein